MKIGIGLPNPVSGYEPFPGVRLVEWARRAEDRGFAGLATIDRVVYPNYDSLATLAAAAGATSRIGLMTNILLGPVYPAALLAKTAVTIDQVSGGRFTLGVAPGSRPDDYVAVAQDFSARGKDFDTELEALHSMWRGEPLEDGGLAMTPAPVRDERVPVLIGGTSDASFRRAVDWGAGLTIGGAAAAQAEPIVSRIRADWSAAGREGEPRIAALAYYSLGGDEASRGYLRHYYANLGEYAEMIAEGAHRTPDAIRDVVRRFADIGVTELYLDPTTSELDQVDRLADAVF